MLTRVFPAAQDPQQNVRLETLVRLRWFAAFGQGAAVLIVHYGLDYALPLWPCLTVIAVAAWLNIACSVRDRMSPRIGPHLAAWLLTFDVAQLATLLYLTGGLQNPFAFLLLGPVLVAAMALPPRYTLTVGAFAVVCATALLFHHEPLPWESDDPLILPPLYMLGIWLSILLTLGYVGVYVWRIAEGARRLSDALTATELALAREQHLSQLDGLAAAAAHELATPLSTIVLVAKELQRSLAADSPYADDVRLLREQSQRCREILGKLTELSTSEPFDRAPLGELLDEVVAPHRGFGIEIEVVVPGRPDAAAGASDEGQPVGRRNPALLYGLGNLVENAVNFARSRVEVVTRWTAKEITVTVADDGPGFASEVIDRLGEPYLTTRGARQHGTDDEPTGLGLGFFIAKTLLERSGATIAFANRGAPEHGAVVRIRWERADFDAPAPEPGGSAWAAAS